MPPHIVYSRTLHTTITTCSVYTVTQCRGGPLPSATRNTYECIKQQFLLIPPLRNILLGEMLTRAWELGVLYCAYCSYGDMAIAVTDNGQVMAALSWPLHVYVYS